MKVTDIPQILDLALRAKKAGHKLNPLFAGDAGIGKSEICQAWAKAQGENFRLLDLRLAYFENPDLVGLPFLEGGKTVFATPKPFPTDGEGLILIEEPNRANPSILNGLMQLLTDYKINDWCVPKGWIIAGVINPDNGDYDTINMDTALRDRFEEYEVHYDKRTFVDFMRTNKWDNMVQSFVESGNWVYKRPKELANGAKYIAPRTLSKINSARLCGIHGDPKMHYEVSIACLGTLIGTEFHKYVYEQSPVLVEDFLKDKKAALAKLKVYSKEDAYRGDLLAATIADFLKGVQEKKIDMSAITEVALIIPGDLAIELVTQSLSSEINDSLDVNEFFGEHPDLHKRLKSANKARSENKKAKNNE